MDNNKDEIDKIHKNIIWNNSLHCLGWKLMVMVGYFKIFMRKDNLVQNEYPYHFFLKYDTYL